MILQASIVFGVSLTLFVGSLLLVNAEQSKGRRIVFVGLRTLLDRMVAYIGRTLRSFAHVVWISVVYVVHHMRSGLAATIAPRPRKRKKNDKLTFNRTDNHLSMMHDHKSDTALSEAQKKKLRNKKLEERF